MASPNFVEKTFVGDSISTKFVIVFSLESFLLYGILLYKATSKLISPAYMLHVLQREVLTEGSIKFKLLMAYISVHDLIFPFHYNV